MLRRGGESHIEEIRGILITTRTNRERSAENELGSLLISRGIPFRMGAELGNGAVLFSTEFPFKAYRAVISSLLSEPMRIYPLVKLKDLERILSLVKIDKMRCYLRKKMEICNDIENYARKIIVGKNLDNTQSSLHVMLHIQGLGVFYGYSPIPRDCERYEMILKMSNLRGFCSSYADKVSALL
ncbi:MAG: hypothetical protein QXT69_06105 [Fervidicoccaceae archaeon]